MLTSSLFIAVHQSLVFRNEQKLVNKREVMWVESERAGEWAQGTSERVNYEYTTGSKEVRVSRKSGVYYIINVSTIGN